MAQEEQEKDLNNSPEEETEDSFEDAFASAFGKGREDEDEEEDTGEEESSEEESSEDESEEEESSQEKEERSEQKEASNRQSSDPRRLANLPVDQLYGVVDSIEDPTVKQQVQEIINRAERFRGSQSALTKKIQGYEKTVSDLQAQIHEVNKREPNNKESRNDAKAPQSLEALKAKYPQLAQAIEDTVQYQKQLGGDALSREEVERMVQKQLEPVQQRMSEETLHEEMERLNDMASELLDTENTGIKASDIISGEYSEDFKAWLNSQPESIMAMARAATDADSAFVLLNMYETAYQKRLKEMGYTGEEEHKPTEQEATKNKQPTKATEITDKRKKRLEKGDTPASASRGAHEGSPDSFEGLFNAWFGDGGKYAKRQRR